MFWKSVPAALCLALAACAGHDHEPQTAAGTPDWRHIATTADRERLRQWRRAWAEALPQARAANAAAMDADSALFDPDHALADAMPPAGDYRCRTIKLGGKLGGKLGSKPGGQPGAGAHDFMAFPWSDCTLSDVAGLMLFEKSGGQQRTVGRIFPDTDARAIYLGTLLLADESAPLRYGLDSSRNMIGYVEHIGAKRWRLVFPRPRFESVIDVLELVPAS